MNPKLPLDRIHGEFDTAVLENVRLALDLGHADAANSAAGHAKIQQAVAAAVHQDASDAKEPSPVRYRDLMPKSDGTFTPYFESQCKVSPILYREFRGTIIKNILLSSFYQEKQSESTSYCGICLPRLDVFHSRFRSHG